MAIMGALDSGLTGDHSTLYAKALLDGIISVVYASTLGIGVALSAIPIFLYQVPSRWVRRSLRRISQKRSSSR